MTDVVPLAREVAERLVQDDTDAVAAMFTDEIQRSMSLADYFEDMWGPNVDELAGRPLRVAEVGAVGASTSSGRITFEGPLGRVIVTVACSEDGRLTNMNISGPIDDGIWNIVIGCPRGRGQEMADFYADLLGMKLLRRDLRKIGTSRSSRPFLVFGGDGWSDERPPRWPDPDYPQQVHLDVLVGDLDVAGDALLAAGATLLQDRGHFRSYTDPVGHPFCLYRDTTRPADGPGILGQIVFDCPEPAQLAGFYGALLGLPVRVEDTDDRIVISRLDGARPLLAFQRSVSPPPRWPEPAHPAQIHLDLYFDDAGPAAADAERLGARLLPPMGGSAAVYADPAGHPFCLCTPAG